MRRRRCRGHRRHRRHRGVGLVPAKKIGDLDRTLHKMIMIYKMINMFFDNVKMLEL